MQPGRLDPFGAFDAAHAAFIGSAAAIADEIAEIMRAGIDSAAELLAAKTIDDVSAVNAGLVRRTVDAALSRSLRLAETGTRLANETWDRLMPMIGASPAA